MKTNYHPYNKILFSNKVEGSTVTKTTWMNLTNIKSKKPDVQSYVLYNGYAF